jgi:flagellar biogenesis protein FliO
VTLALIAQALGALCVVLALVVLAGRAARLREHAAGGAPNALRVAATLALDPRRRLHLVQTETGQLLVLTGSTHETMMPWPPHAGG